MSKRKARAKEPPARRRRGLPTPESVQATIPFVAKGGAKFTILRTTEKDSYDPPVKATKALRTPRKTGRR
jgi:hypothetical protein